MDGRIYNSGMAMAMAMATCYMLSHQYYPYRSSANHTQTMSPTSLSATRSPQKKSPPPHLSEFYPYVNVNTTDNNITNNNNHASTVSSGASAGATTMGHHHILDTSSSFSENRLSDPYPDTYTHFPLINNNTKQHRNNSISHETITSYQSSIADLPVLIKTQDVKDTMQCYQSLIKASVKYRESLLQTANAASEFGNALEECARCKGSGLASDGLMNSSGLHYLISNHQQILSKSIKTDFESPLQTITDEFYKNFQISDKEFKDSISIKTQELRKKEISNYKLSKQKTRNIVAYKSNLLNLASQLDDIDRLKHDHYEDVFNRVQQSALDILNQSISVIKGESIIYNNISSKSELIHEKLSKSYGNHIEPFKFEDGVRNTTTKNATDEFSANNITNMTSSSNETLQNTTYNNLNLHFDDRDAFGNEVDTTDRLSSDQSPDESRVLMDDVLKEEQPLGSSGWNGNHNGEHTEDGLHGDAHKAGNAVVYGEDDGDYNADKHGDHNNHDDHDDDDDDDDKDESFSLPTPASKGNTSLTNDLQNEWDASRN